MGIALKIVISVAGIVIVAGVFGIVKMRALLSRNSRGQKSEETIYNGEGTKNALILYQESPHGTVGAMAKTAAEALQDMGYTVVLNHPSSELEYDLSLYQVIGFGSAVYIGTISEALLQYMKEHTFSGKKVFLLSVGKNLEEKGELSLMEKWINEGNMVSKVKVSKGEEKLVDSIIRQQFR